MTDDRLVFHNGDLIVSRDGLIKDSHAKESDIIVVSGTLLEGIGNSHSDIDVYVITEYLSPVEEIGKHNYVGSEKGLVRQFYDYLPEGNFGLDVEFYTVPEIHALFDRMISLAERAAMNTKIYRPKLNTSDSDAIHKLLIGKCLAGSARLKTIIESRHREAFCFLQYRNKIGGYPEFKDIAGAYASKDVDTALYNARIYLAQQISALCHISGNTNSKPKWLMQNIKSLPEKDSNLGQAVMSFLFTEARTQSAKMSLFKDWCELVDQVFLATHEYLAAATSFGFNIEEAIKLTEVEFEQEEFHDKQTVLEFQHRRRLSDRSGPSIPEIFEACTTP